MAANTYLGPALGRFRNTGSQLFVAEHFQLQGSGGSCGDGGGGVAVVLHIPSADMECKLPDHHENTCIAHRRILKYLSRVNETLAFSSSTLTQQFYTDSGLSRRT